MGVNLVHNKIPLKELPISTQCALRDFGRKQIKGHLLPLQTLAAVPHCYHSGTLFHCTGHSK